MCEASLVGAKETLPSLLRTLIGPGGGGVRCSRVYGGILQVLEVHPDPKYTNRGYTSGTINRDSCGDPEVFTVTGVCKPRIKVASRDRWDGSGSDTRSSPLSNKEEG